MGEQPELVVRWSRPGDEPGLLELLQSAYKRWPGVETSAPPLDHLVWKYEDIGVQSGRHGVAVADGRIVGAIPLSTRTFLVDGRPLQATTAWDVAVHPDFRGAGVMMQLQHFGRSTYRDGVDFNFGYEAPHPAMVRGREKIGQWQVMTHRIDVLTADLERMPASGPTGGVAVEEVERVDERFDALCAEAMQPFRLVALREQRYFRWRYFDRRGGDFTVLAAREGRDVTGFAALRVSNGRGYLADVLALPGRTDVVGQLVREGARRLRALGVSSAVCWVPQLHPYREVVVAAGFSRVKRTMAFTYEVLQAPEGALAFLAEPDAQMHVMIGDTDLV
jgi:hypothetical protein